MAFGNTAHNAHTVLPCFKRVDIPFFCEYLSNSEWLVSQKQGNSGRTSLENQKGVTES